MTRCQVLWKAEKPFDMAAGGGKLLFVIRGHLYRRKIWLGVVLSYHPAQVCKTNPVAGCEIDDAVYLCFARALTCS